MYNPNYDNYPPFAESFAIVFGGIVILTVIAALLDTILGMVF